MDLESIIQSKWDRERQTPYDIAYMENLFKKDRNELIYKTEIDTHIENKHGYQGGKEKGGIN